MLPRVRFGLILFLVAVAGVGAALAIAYDSDFTGSDWFQIAYPVALFLAGLVLAERRAPAPATASAAVEVSLTVTVEAAVAAAQVSPPRESSSRSRQSWLDDDPVAVLVLGLAGLLLLNFVLAWLFIEGRDVVLALAGGLVALSLGLLAGSVSGRVASHSFARDWRAALACGSCLALGAAACGFALVNPPAAPAGYAALLEAYQERGVGLTDVIDSPFVRFVGSQAVGLVLLGLASAAMALTGVSILSRGALLAGARRTRLRVLLAGRLPGRAWLIGALVAITAMLALSFFFGAGYAYRAWPALGSADAPPKIVTASASSGGGAIRVRLVADGRGRVRLVLREQGAAARVLATVPVAPGRNQIGRRIRRSLAPGSALSLVPLSPDGQTGTRVRIDVPG